MSFLFTLNHFGDVNQPVELSIAGDLFIIKYVAFQNMDVPLLQCITACPRVHAHPKKSFPVLYQEFLLCQEQCIAFTGKYCLC